jgi:hypothetical protein
MTIDSTDAAATKILLSESEMPRRWYNLVADLPAPPPPVLHPGTRQPVGPDDLRPLFPMASGTPRSPSPAPSSGWSARSGRCAPRTTRSRTAS